ncbi:MAG: zinc-binding dehydrogenase [Lewinellaceae bacterium]|nr:zinc-binding dehydrogenase [Lewinellaceae bacterium]
MKALVLQNLQKPLVFQEVETPVPGAGSVLVRLQSAALNRRDWWITQGQYAKIQLPVILGSDGAGVCNGKAVVLYPALDWGDNPAAQGNKFRVLGLPENGTLAEYICVPRANIAPKPEHLTWEQAAALPLAGLTAYRTLFTRCALRPGERVLITGIGGGVALLAMQFALAAGAEVYVTSGSEEKIEKAVHLGATGGANYHTSDWDKALKNAVGGFDVVVDSAGGDGFALLPGLCKPGARIGIYGGSLGKINGLSPQILFWKQISILGSTMGTPEEFTQMLDFVSRHRIVPVVDSVFPLSDGNAALQRLAEGTQFGKVVLTIPDSDVQPESGG